ncbi:DUF2809 domain-containing protein [Rhodovarius crocodyli]|uniref:DUF2809 domain-containing protein n=1 Tax=Rhodovarius crocodyli TaxID=1979269 RepID=A0A437MCJ9_9PROT|nr:DUF2809 domain-containing protein [Rhodovarius crocodyli]RVT95345.1 DUF2809 domain-containing protein [Rhodovarius crocodyli]
MKRWLAVLAVASVGIGLRLIPVGLPWELTKYGGSLAWGAMFGLLGRMVAPRWAPWPALWVLLAGEMLKLVQDSWLVALRANPVAGFLLGRTFSWWAVLAYAVGALLVEILERRPKARRTEGGWDDLLPVLGLRPHGGRRRP